MPSFEFDIHTHTIASGHATHATIMEMIKAARTANLTAIGISDHGPATAGGAKPSYFRSLAHADKHRFGLEVLYGAEANILDNNGLLDLEDSILEKLDYGIASMHRPVKKPGTAKENTLAYISAMKNPNIHIIGHCDDTHYPVYYPDLVEAAMEHHVLLEINNSSLSPEGYRGDTRHNVWMILNLCKQFHYPVVLSSDSHGPGHVGDFSYAMEMVRAAEMPDELILNYSLESLRDFL